MHRKLLFIFFAILSLTFISKLHANELEKVTMQLRWLHQYQFAGYYAAKHKGFYEQAGFDVEIIAGGPNKLPVSEVLEGRADFAEGNSEVLIKRLSGEPIVALAAIFQHSPSVLLTMADSNITKAAQLKGKKVMMAGTDNDADLIAMLRAAGLAEHDISIQQSSYNLNDLIENNTQAFNSYLTNEPFFIEEQGLQYNVIAPKDYGVDFYSDILFTSEKRVKNNPESVERFKQASLKGWQYAINHSEEIIQLIKQEYNSEKTLNHMRFEALTVNSLVKSDLLPIGHMFPRRFENMANVFLEQNMIIDKENLTGFIFEPPESLSSHSYLWIISISFISFVSLAIFVLILKMNAQIKRDNKQRTSIENKLKKQTETDHLTQLFNRATWLQHCCLHQNDVIKGKQSFSLILLEIDNLKEINQKYGQQAGDDVLVMASNLLKMSLKEQDICARFDSTKFIWLLPQTNIKQATLSAEKVKQQFEQHTLLIKDQHISFSASFGLVKWQKQELNEALVKAEDTLKQAKKFGKNKIEIILSDK